MDNTLHIYGQRFQHEPVLIGGSYAALQDLADTIIAAALPVSNTVAVSIAQDRAKQCRKMIDKVDRAA